MIPAPCLEDGHGGGQALWLTCADGVRIRVVLWASTGARGTVLILPGRTEHAEKYGPTAARLAAAGYAAAAIDWRGQGLADRLLPDPRKGHVGRFADYQLDLSAFRMAVKAAGLPAPLFLLAHSMGGCIGLRGLVQGLEVAAAAFSAPMWGLKVPGGQPRLLAAAFTGMSRAGLRGRYAPPPASGATCYLETGAFADNTLTTDRGEWDWMQGQLRANPELVIAGPTIGWLAEALAEIAALSRLPSPAVPCIAAVGGHERIVDPAAIVARMSRWPGGELMEIPGAEHEILMETEHLRARFLSGVVAMFDAQQV